MTERDPLISRFDSASIRAATARFDRGSTVGGALTPDATEETGSSPWPAPTVRPPALTLEPDPPPRRRTPQVIWWAAAAVVLLGLVGSYVATRDDEGLPEIADVTGSNDEADEPDPTEPPATSPETAPETSPPTAAAPSSTDGPVATEAVPSTVAATSSPPAFAVGQCLTSPSDAFDDPVVVPCDDPSAADLVTAVASTDTIECPPAATGSSASHTRTTTTPEGVSTSFSWCTEPVGAASTVDPSTDNVLAIGSCYRSAPTSDGKTEITEQACLEGAGLKIVIGEDPLGTCQSMPESTSTLSKLASEGTGVWCVKDLP
ncbi:MAG: hypothetical protein AB7L17_19255 [Ilumatobacteraceae bacterium]